MKMNNPKISRGSSLFRGNHESALWRNNVQRRLRRRPWKGLPETRAQEQKRPYAKTLYEDVKTVVGIHGTFAASSYEERSYQ